MIFSNFLQDCRFAARNLRRAPVSAAVAVASLGLGIGANTAVYSVIDGVLVEPPPYPGGDDLVFVRGYDRGDPTNPTPPPPAERRAGVSALNIWDAAPVVQWGRSTAYPLPPWTSAAP